MSERYPLTESVEMYLKAIYQVVREKQAARAKDIAIRLNVNSSSVTAALKHLAGRGFINYEPYDIITLTPEELDDEESLISGYVRKGKTVFAA